MPTTIEFARSRSREDAIYHAAAEQRIESGYWDIFHQRHETSQDTQCRILQALGWDMSSKESIDAQREQRFRSFWTSPVPETVVAGASQRHVPVTIPGHWNLHTTVTLLFQLECGGSREHTADLGQMRVACEIVIDDERWRTYNVGIPVEIPNGYHRVSIRSGENSLGEGTMIVSPDRAYLPEPLMHGARSAGFNVTLYGLRSDRNWGCGDFTDLRELTEWAHSELGVSFLGLNPLHALHNRVPYNTSPYLPLSIFYKNFIYVDIEAVPEFARSSAARALAQSDRTRRELQRLRESEFVLYGDVHRLKLCFLKLLFREFRRTAPDERRRAFDNYCAREADLLHNFALYCALDEVLHKQDRRRWTWRDWPAPFQSPQSPETQQFAKDHERLITLYKYVQFVIDEQLTAAQNHALAIGMPIGLYHDLALATDNCGADLWAYRDFYVNGCRVGAPPDDFSPNGQDWAFPPPNAEAHRRSGYRLYRESIRKIVAAGGALRIDHVMRLFRLFWIPEGQSAASGSYVRDYANDLLHILALESVRAKNIIVGEDLGTVTDQIRDSLADFGILSYRLFYFEQHRDGRFKQSTVYPRQALVASSTHDLPTMAGFWLGRDVEARRQAGLASDHDAQQQHQRRDREKQHMLDVLHGEDLLPGWYPRDARQVPEVDGPLHNATVGFLARTPSMLLLLNQEDLTKETEQQNLPGSTSEYPNWQRKMRAPIKDLRSGWAPFANMFRAQLEQNGRGQI